MFTTWKDSFVFLIIAIFAGLLSWSVLGLIIWSGVYAWSHIFKTMIYG